jgi:hypothetical protein
MGGNCSRQRADDPVSSRVIPHPQGVAAAPAGAVRVGKSGWIPPLFRLKPAPCGADTGTLRARKPSVPLMMK